MPSSRQLRAIGLVTLITILVLYYVTHGERLTHGSEFYKKTVTAIENRHDAEARQHLIEEERQRQARVERLQKEHDVAMASATAEIASNPSKDSAAAGPPRDEQQPILEGADGTEKSVAGRKKMKDGKIVDARPATDNDDGVAKVGNVAPKASSASSGETDTASEYEQEVEAELNDILKKGPIIIFSKSYCPYSRKAKHILLEEYAITPPPYVVELDHHKLGSSLQDALLKMTGRRTVPNILINGKSVGGGDDIQEMHQLGLVIQTVQAMGGKRIMSIRAGPGT